MVTGADGVPLTTAAQRRRFAEIVLLAWQCGREYVRDDLAETVDDLSRVTLVPAVVSTPEERIARRHGEMLIYALRSRTTWRGLYPGGPVDWENGAVIP